MTEVKTKKVIGFNTGKGQTWQDNILMRSIKILDIGYIFALYFMIALLLAYYTDKILGKFDKNEAIKIPKWKIILELFLACWLYGILCYIVRNTVEMIPFPLHNYNGYDHYKIRELGSAWVFGFVFLTCSSNMKDRLIFVLGEFSNNKKGNNNDIDTSTY